MSILGMILLWFFVATLLSSIWNGYLFRVLYFGIWGLFLVVESEAVLLLWNISCEQYMQIGDNTIRAMGLNLIPHIGIIIIIYFVYLFNRLFSWFEWWVLDRWILALFSISSVLTIGMHYWAEASVPIE